MTDAAHPATAEELAVLDAACFPPDQRWSVAAWADELRADDRLLGVRRDAGALVAAATVQVVARDADLHRIMVAPGHRGRGLARGLLEEMLRRTAGRAGRILLEVRDDNVAAIALYRGFGFEVIAARADYYGPGIHARVMERRLAPRHDGID